MMVNNHLTKKGILIVSIIAIIILTVTISVILLKNNTSTVLLEKTTYHYPYKKVIRINDDGKIYEAKIVDELSASGTAPKNDYSYTKNVSDEDLESIKSIINHMGTEERNNHSESYGISVNLDEDTLSGCEYFNQKEVDKLNSIIIKYE